MSGRDSWLNGEKWWDMQVREFRQTVQYRENSSLLETNNSRLHYDSQIPRKEYLEYLDQLDSDKDSFITSSRFADENVDLFSSKKRVSTHPNTVAKKKPVSARRQLPTNGAARTPHPATDHTQRSNAQNRRRGESDRVRAVLRQIWDHAVEAFCFLAADGGDAVSRPELRQGLRALGLGDVDVDRLLVEAGGEESAEAGSLSLWQFVRQLGWKRGGLGCSVREAAALRDHIRAAGMPARAAIAGPLASPSTQSPWNGQQPGHSSPRARAIRI